MMAAGIAAQNGNNVYLFEKNNKLGKKLYITGKGRCNLTNSGDIQNFIDNILRNPFFMYSAFYNFSNCDTVKFFKELGVETKVERGGRIFPVSDKASDIVNAFERFLKKNKVNINCGCEIKDILVDGKTAIGVSTSNSKIYGDSIIIATGGISYAVTGSTGDGYRFAKNVGHTVTKLYPSLVPLNIKQQWCKDLQGLTLKNISIEIKDINNKTIYSDFGELLFTHYGVSGPVILSASGNIAEAIYKNLTLYVDLKPALDAKALDNRILRDFDMFKNKVFKNSLDELLPQKLIPVIVMLSGIDENKKVNEITKLERRYLVNILKNFKMDIEGTRGYSEAVITMGGVDTDEIEPSTMESKIVKNLFFAGEIIDVDAYTGGYNLQIAFSTGYTAGINS